MVGTNRVEKDFEFVNCNLCNSVDLSKIYEIKDCQIESGYIFDLVRCNSCGLVFLNPRPKDMLQFYPDSEQTEEKDIFFFLKPNRVKLVRKFKKTGKIFDIGCGFGYFLNAMKKDGWEDYGNEISGIRYNFAKDNLKLGNIHKRDFLELDIEEGFFDLVTMWHTLEHMEDPKAVLRKAKKILNKDGVLIIEVPNFNSIQRRLFMGRSYAIDAPRHLYHFTNKTLKKILEQEGFLILKKDYLVNFRITFIDLKKSILRLFRKDHVVVKKYNKNKTKVLRKLIVLSFNIVSLVATLTLELLNSSSCQRVYCKKGI